MKVYCVVLQGGRYYDFVQDAFVWDLDFSCITKSKEFAEKCRDELLRFYDIVGIMEGEIL